MSDNYIKLYNTAAKPDSVFLLGDGSVYFYVSNTDKYAITGKNLILGATEVIMRHFLNTEIDRVETAVAGAGASLKKIGIDKFREGMRTFSFALNVSMVLAKQVQLTNNIIKKNIQLISGDENKLKEYSVEFYRIVDRLQKEYDKRKFPWLKNLIKDHETSLTYKKGEAYFKSAEPVRLDAGVSVSGKEVEYQRGDVICEEDTMGGEMFILKNGAIDVHIHGNRVAGIEEPGTVIGEMALLLGEKRTATLIARNNVTVAKIGKADLSDSAVKNSDMMSGIAMSLAKRHYYNLVKIESINKSIIDRSVTEEISGEKKAPQSQRALKDLKTLQMAVEDACKGKDSEFIKDLLQGF